MSPAANLATDPEAVAAYDEPGSWGRLSEGWPSTPYTPGKFLLCTKAHVVPYGQYVVVGAEHVPEGIRRPGAHWSEPSRHYDYANAVIRCATTALRDRLELAHREMFVECREWIERELSGDMTE